MNDADKNACILSVQGVSKKFDGFTAVDDLSFELPRGVIGGLIGPNGAGKTTLFNTLAGLLKPDTGNILLDGSAIHPLPPHRVFSAGLARTFQIPRPFAQMTVLENLMTVPENQAGEHFWNNVLRPKRVARQEQELRESAREIIDFCDLTRVQGDHANTLSGGQLKLLELARVLMSRPKLILLDEPAAGINPTLMLSLVDKITELNKRGYTFLIIEHNMDVVMSICDPILVMAQGKRIYYGDGAGARQEPAVLDAYLGGLP